MLNWMNVNFNVLINNNDKSKLENLITEFIYELNNYTGSNIELKNDISICGVSSIKFKDNCMTDNDFEKILEKGLEERENK